MKPVITAIAVPSFADTPANAQVQQEINQQTRLQSQAQEQQSQLQIQQKVQEYLKARYELVSARVEFTTGVMSDLVSLVPQASFLNEHIDRLNSDLAELYTYVEACDVRGFNVYVSGTLAQDYNDALHAIRQAYSSFAGWAVSTDTMNCLREKYNERHEAYKYRIQGIVIIKPDRNALISASANADAVRNTQANTLRAASAAGLTSANAIGKVNSVGARLMSSGNARRPVIKANASVCAVSSPVPVAVSANA